MKKIISWFLILKELPLFNEELPTAPVTEEAPAETEPVKEEAPVAEAPAEAPKAKAKKPAAKKA